ncbi:MAG: hypothetical protein KGO94_12950 [Alphaproteobacteria bacterium]|nr:hypothetical protein [Alphaproteobacteria bacterium]
MFDWIEQIQWTEVSALLNSGSPSILQQLVVVNTISVAVIFYLRMRRKQGVRYRRNYFLQEMLLLANMIVLSEDQFMPLFHARIEPVIYNFKHWVL